MTPAQARKLYVHISGLSWRIGDTTSETPEGEIYAYRAGHELVGKRTKDHVIMRRDPISGKWWEGVQ